jgi:NAD(P)-dependent dehydrogenase (short-subunit alcohol dehydrogenase family)|tara:strand:- start:103 stop:900 length:798 start_codon:yes stop_codon:yes gene_type:complete
MNMTERLAGKVAIVTGGNSGIGSVTAHLFAREGAKVALMARREDQGKNVEKAIRDEGGDATYIQCDVSDSSAVNAAVDQTIDRYGTVNILFNNAGYGSGQVFPDESDDSFNAILAVNMGGTFHMTRSVWPHLIEAGGGAIVNMSSVAAQRGFSRKMRDIAGTASMSYYAAKAGVDAMTRYLAGMGGEYKIRVNCVRPGQIITPGATGGGRLEHHVFKDAFDVFQILDGPGYPEDVANTVLFLACDDSRFLTGEFINIDGGIAAKL